MVPPDRAWLGKHKARYPLQARFPMLPVRTWLTTFTVPRLTPGGLLSARLSPASPGAFPQIRIRLVALLRRPPDSGTSPCTRLSRAPRWGVTPTSTTTDPPPRIRQLFVPTWRFSPQGRFPFRGLFWLGPWRVRLGSSLAYSPLSFASRARFPVQPSTSIHLHQCGCQPTVSERQKSCNINAASHTCAACVVPLPRILAG